MSDELIKRLGMAQIGACSCMTKSPDLEWHDESCKYRLFCEAADLIEQQAARIAALESAEKEAVPVAWQVRRADGRIDGLPIQWENCTKDLYDATLESGRYAGYENGPRCEVRELYAALASKDAIRREALEEVAIQWDGCFYEGVAERIDIGAAIRALSQKVGDQQ